jgi:hypothetical protein
MPMRLALHMRARAGAERGEPADGLGELAAAVERAAGTDRVWLAVDPALATGDDGSLAQRLDSLPLERVAGERAGAARDALAAYLHGLAAAEPEFARDEWPPLESGLALRAEGLREAMLAGEAGLLGRTLAGLGLASGGTARVALVPEAPSPGAVTYLARGGPASVVGVRGLDEDTLLEVTLHETIHAFDAMAMGERDDALVQLRRGLGAAGLDDRDPRFRAAWHALFFAHAAEMVRREGRPAYVDYGTRFGVYERTGEVAEVVRTAWPSVLDGELAVETFVARVAAAAAASPADAHDGAKGEEKK